MFIGSIRIEKSSLDKGGVTMKSYWKKLLLSLFFFVLYGNIFLPAGLAQQTADVSLPTFNITMNGVKIDNNERLYPIIVYKDITYVPMTYSDSRFLGLETKWSSGEGLQVNKVSVTTNYNPDRGYFNRTLENAFLPEFRIRVNGKEIYNRNETYPLLLFRDITYFPLTWRFMVDEFGWTSSFDGVNGLIINSKGSKIGYPTTPTTELGQVFDQDFGSVKVIFDRSSNNQPGNLYVKENNVIRKIGNPNYIYGVGYLQAGTYGEYTAVDRVEYANRWVYTLAVDPSVSPIVSRNVRINIDTNEVQTTDGGTIADPISLSDKVYSKQFDNITVMLDRSSNQQPGNLYIKEHNIIRRIGNPNYIYGVSYFKVGPFVSYNPVNNLDLTNRWVYTVAIDTTKSTLSSRNVKVNIDTNEVQFL